MRVFIRIVGKLPADSSRKKAYVPRIWRNYIIIIIIIIISVIIWIFYQFDTKFHNSHLFTFVFVLLTSCCQWFPVYFCVIMLLMSCHLNC